MYYGNPEVTSGGIALKFFASVRLEIRPTGKIKSVSINLPKFTNFSLFYMIMIHYLTRKI